MKTGLGAIVVIGSVVLVTHLQLKQVFFEEWLCSKSGIDKKHFEGEIYEEIKDRVNSSVRYTRNSLKDIVRVHS